MINHVVLMFFPTDEKTPNEQGGNRTVIRFKSVAVRSIVHKGDRCYTGRFATKIFSVTQRCNLLEQCCYHLKKCRNNVATLCRAKNRNCELSRITSSSIS